MGLTLTQELKRFADSHRNNGDARTADLLERAKNEIFRVNNILRVVLKENEPLDGTDE